MLTSKEWTRLSLSTYSQGNEPPPQGQSSASLLHLTTTDHSHVDYVPPIFFVQLGDVVEITGFLDESRQFYIIEPETIVVVECWKDKYGLDGQGQVGRALLSVSTG